MIHMDVPKVRGKMAERGLTISSLSEMLGINRNTLSSYLDNPGKTPYEIVSRMAEILCDSGSEANIIFFAENLRNTKDNDA